MKFNDLVKKARIVAAFVLAGFSLPAAAQVKQDTAKLKLPVAAEVKLPATTPVVVDCDDTKPVAKPPVKKPPVKKKVTKTPVKKPTVVAAPPVLKDTLPPVNNTTIHNTTINNTNIINNNITINMPVTVIEKTDTVAITDCAPCADTVDTRVQAIAGFQHFMPLSPTVQEQKSTGGFVEAYKPFKLGKRTAAIVGAGIDLPLFGRSNAQLPEDGQSFIFNSIGTVNFVPRVFGGIEHKILVDKRNCNNVTLAARGGALFLKGDTEGGRATVPYAETSAMWNIKAATIGFSVGHQFNKTSLWRINYQPDGSVQTGEYSRKSPFYVQLKAGVNVTQLFKKKR